MKKRRILAGALSACLAAGLVIGGVPAVSALAADPVVTEIPNTDRTEKEYDTSFLSVTGFAEGHVNDRTEYLGTEYHRVVNNEEEFVKAIDDARTGRVKIIEITQDLDLGYDHLTDEAKSANCIRAYEQDIHVALTNPAVMISGISQLEISNTNGLTIFSRAGVTVRRAEWKLQGTSSDIIIRNIKFDGMWQWSEGGSTKDAGWSLMKVNGAKGVWLDHCTFTNAVDGCVDSENGASDITYSWCVVSVPTDETPDQDSTLYQTITYMEYLYENGLASADGRYYKFREGGASPEEIMAYEAYHSKAMLNGAGDKDYKDNEQTGTADGNQRLSLTLAYDKVNNIGQRLPMIRQGVGHMYNVYVDNMAHMKLHSTMSGYSGSSASWGINRAINSRNGASIAADTCVFYGVDQVLIGAEKQGRDTGNMNSPWDVLFADAYNHSLVVNSEVTLTNGQTYTGSSWDNNGNNLFARSFTWVDKTTIGKWAWSSAIVGVENMERLNPPSEPFEFTYGYDEELPYSYQTVPLEDVRTIVDSNAGAYTYNEAPEFWVRTHYTADEEFTPVSADTVVEMTDIELNLSEYQVSLGDTVQLITEVHPSNATDKTVEYSSSNPDVAEVLASGLVIAKQNGTATITATASNGDTAECEITVYTAVTGLTLESRSKTAYTGTDLKLGYTITPDDATNKEVVWSSSNTSVATVDEDGTIHPLTAGRTTITCKSAENADIKATCTLTVKEGTAPTEEPTDEPEPTEEPTDEPGPTEGPTDDPISRKAGDVDGNGVVDAADALAVLKHAAQIESITDEESFAAGDLDENGQLEAADALEILKIAAQLS